MSEVFVLPCVRHCKYMYIPPAAFCSKQTLFFQTLGEGKSLWNSFLPMKVRTMNFFGVDISSFFPLSDSSFHPCNYLSHSFVSVFFLLQIFLGIQAYVLLANRRTTQTGSLSFKTNKAAYQRRGQTAVWLTQATPLASWKQRGLKTCLGLLPLLPHPTRHNSLPENSEPPKL